MQEGISNLIARIQSQTTQIADRIVGGKDAGYEESCTKHMIAVNIGMMNALEILGYSDAANELAKQERQQVYAARLVAQFKSKR